jgi:hypothetical protein
MTSKDSTIIEIKNNCYCCFIKTKHRSKCDCQAYICKKCYKKYKKYENECKICKTKLKVKEKCCLRLSELKLESSVLRASQNNCTEIKSKIEEVCLLFIINIIFNPCTVSIILLACGIGLFLLPCIIVSILVAILTKNTFYFYFDIRTWFSGLFIIAASIVVIFIFTCIITQIYLLIQCIIKDIQYMRNIRNN